MANKALLGVLVVVIIVIVAVAAFELYKPSTGANTQSSGGSSKTTNTTKASTSISVSTTIAPTNASTTAYCTPQSLCTGGGLGQSYFSESQAVSLIGSGGSYTVTYVNSSQFASTGGGGNTILRNNVTDYWDAGYGQLNNIPERIVYELVFQSPNAKGFYGAWLGQTLTMAENKSNTAETYNITTINATLNGVTYSYFRWKGVSSEGGELLGYKGGEMVYAVAPFELNESTVAAVITEDLT